MFSDELPGFVNAGSPRVRMGLGTIARIVASGDEIYAESWPLPKQYAASRASISPYHRVLRRLVEETEATSGGICSSTAIRCHRQPAAHPGRGGRYRSRRLPRRGLRSADRRGGLQFPRRARLRRRDQRPLCGRVHDRPLRPPQRAPPRIADRGQPRLVHGRAELLQKGALSSAGRGHGGFRRAPGSSRARVPGKASWRAGRRAPLRASPVRGLRQRQHRLAADCIGG